MFKTTPKIRCCNGGSTFLGTNNSNSEPALPCVEMQITVASKPLYFLGSRVLFLRTVLWCTTSFEERCCGCCVFHADLEWHVTKILSKHTPLTSKALLKKTCSHYLETHTARRQHECWLHSKIKFSIPCFLIFRQVIVCSCARNVN